jgi:hypothetical protein
MALVVSIGFVAQNRPPELFYLSSRQTLISTLVGLACWERRHKRTFMARLSSGLIMEIYLVFPIRSTIGDTRNSSRHIRRQHESYAEQLEGVDLSYESQMRGMPFQRQNSSVATEE